MGDLGCLAGSVYQIGGSLGTISIYFAFLIGFVLFVFWFVSVLFCFVFNCEN